LTVAPRFRAARRFRLAVLAALAVWVVSAAPDALAQTCSFNTGQPTTTSFGAIDPAGSTPVTFTITINYKCTGGATAVLTVTGANDTGPGAYRLKNLAAPTQFMPYTIATTNLPGTKITLDGTIVAANYRNAWVSNYSDTLTVLVLP
jgi:hypothetical protein